MLYYSCPQSSPHKTLRPTRTSVSEATVEKTMTNRNKEMEGLREIEAFARNEFAKTNSGEYLGPLVDVQRQVVAGFNYKLTFESNSKRVDVFVFDQPSSSTREIINIEASTYTE